MSNTEPETPPVDESRSRWRVVLVRVLLGALVILVVMQLVPYGWHHSNPPVIRDAPWPDDASAEIARTSCYSCHSNETDWPAYSYVAPMSWLVRYDVDRARDEFNFSDWDRYGDDADDAIDVIEDGEMPLGRYTMIHREAKLTVSEADTLIAALREMSGDDGGDDDNSGHGSGSAD
jgi:hypothetical protein